MLELDALGLKEGDLVLLDTAPLIYLIDAPDRDPAGLSDQERERRAVVSFFAECARSGKLRLTASAVAWTECLSGPLAAGDGHRADSFRRTLADSSFLTLEPVDAAIADEAARLLATPKDASGKYSRPARRLEFADALHIATASVVGAAAILTNDEAWKNFARLAAAGVGRGGQVCRDIKVLLVEELAFDTE